MPGCFSLLIRIPDQIFLWYVLLFFVGKPVFAQNPDSDPFILSPRIGAEIDSLEAEYFNLFPEIDHVRGAVYRKDSFGNLQMLVSLATGRDTTITFSVLGAVELTKYIEKYEVLPDSVKLVNWSLLPGFDPGKRNFYENYGAKVFVYSNNGANLSAGRLLKITDQNVYLWKTKKYFQPSLMRYAMEKIPAADISKIERRQDLTGKLFGMSLGAGIGIAIMNPVSLVGADNLSLENTVFLMAGGAIIGAALGWAFDLLSISRRKYKINGDPERYKKARKKLQKRAKFSNVFPPELKTL